MPNLHLLQVRFCIENADKHGTALTLFMPPCIQGKAMKVAYFDCFSGAAGDMRVPWLSFALAAAGLAILGGAALARRCA